MHLLHAELLDELGLAPGELGESIATRGIDLLALSTGAPLHLGDEAVVEVTDPRNPCLQIEAHQAGLFQQVVGHDADGEVERNAGVMSVVRRGGVVRAGDAVRLEVPVAHVPMQRV